MKLKKKGKENKIPNLVRGFQYKISNIIMNEKKILLINENYSRFLCKMSKFYYCNFKKL